MFDSDPEKLRTSGRPKKAIAYLTTAREWLAEKKKHPVEALWYLYEKTQNERLKKEILVALLPYCEGKLKDQEGKVVNNPEESRQAAEETLKILKELEKDAHKKKE